VRVPFHALDTVALVAGAISIPCSPNNSFSDRLAGIADGFDEYRLIQLKYRVRIDISTAANSLAMAFYPGVLTTPPASFAQLGENPYLSLRQTDDDVMLPYVVVPRGVLAGEQSWYKSQKAPITADDAIPGTLYFFGVGTDNVQCEVDGIFEFRGESDPTNTPLSVEMYNRLHAVLLKRVAIWQKLQIKSRDDLLKLLNYQESSVQSAVTRWQNPTKPDERSYGGITSAQIATGSSKTGRM